MIRVMPCTQPDSAATSRSPCQSVGAPRGSVSETCSGAPPVCEPALGSGSPAAGRVEGAKYIVGHPSQYQLVNHTQWQTRCEWGCHSCDSHPDIARGAPFTAHGCTAIARYTHVCCARAARGPCPSTRPAPPPTHHVRDVGRGRPGTRPLQVHCCKVAGHGARGGGCVHPRQLSEWQAQRGEGLDALWTCRAGVGWRLGLPT